MADFETLHWQGDGDLDITGRLVLIDQTRLPGELIEIELTDVEAVWEAIRVLRVRGAPAIGVAAAYGVCVGIQTVPQADEDALFARISEVCDYLATSRPTAVNLFWALDRMRSTAAAMRGKESPTGIATGLLAEAIAIHEEDRQMCAAIGRFGADLLPDDCGVLTHCNAGALATGGSGTALSVFYAAHEAGKKLHVYCDETRPLLQGARLSAWELKQRGLDVTLICDSMAAQVMREDRVQAIVTGADRIAANGDAANKIGTYQVALAAAAHDIPFYVAAPSSTFDLSLSSGEEIPIEERDPAEITAGFGPSTAPDGIGVYNPAFDVTPAELIKAIICERGVIEPVTAENVAEMLG